MTPLRRNTPLFDVMRQMSAKRWVSWAVPVAIAAALYLPGLGTTPQYFGGDEAHFGNQAYAIATTGRDLAGHAFPLFFNLSDPLGETSSVRWYQPTLFYLTAVVLKVRSLTESSVRLPAALLGLLDVGLFYTIALQWFGDRRHAALAAMLLVCSPPHLIFSRQATDYICSLPFVLGWLTCMIRMQRHRTWVWPLAAGALLGLGCYSYIAAWIMMPILALVTCVAVYSLDRNPRPVWLAAIGFAVPIVPLVWWLVTHPQMLVDTFGRYEHAGFRGASSMTRATSLNVEFVRHMVSTYWSYFDPAFLFLTGGISPTTATGRTGVFLASLIVLLPLGIVELWQRRELFGRILPIGFFAAPIPATLVGEPYMIQRALLLVPFGLLIAIAGLTRLAAQPRRRLAAWLLLVAMPLQFAYFLRDYAWHYRFRSAAYFDPHDFRSIASNVFELEDSTAVPLVYLSRQLDDASPRWRFYATKERRDALLARTRYFDGDGLDLADAARGSLMVFVGNDQSLAAVVASGRWVVVRTIVEPSGGTRSVILRKI